MENTNEKMTFKVINDEGKETECEVLFTFDSDEFKKSYIVFTDGTLDDNGNIKVYANTYDPSGEDINLGVIENDEEWKVIENLLASLQEKLGANNEVKEEDN